MAIVDKLKDEIRERGGSVAGIKDIESAIKELNKLDNGGGSGGGGGVLVINGTVNKETGITTLDKTAGEIIEAAQNKQMVVLSVDFYDDSGRIFLCPLIVVLNVGSSINFGFLGPDRVKDFGVMTFTAATEDDYPTTEEPSGSDSGIG